jgi:hypothetical protein
VVAVEQRALVEVAGQELLGERRAVVGSLRLCGEDVELAVVAVAAQGLGG